MEGSGRAVPAQPLSPGAERPSVTERRISWRSRELIHAIVDGFAEHDLLTYASAIAYQILTAVVPFLLTTLAMIDLLHLDSLWLHHLEPNLRSHVSRGLFDVIRNAVNDVFSRRRLLWVTFGSLLTLWQVSGAVRAVMGAFRNVYSAPHERSFVRRYLISFALSIEVGLCFLGVLLCLLLAPFIRVTHPGELWLMFAFVVRWMLIVALLFIAVGLLVRHATPTSQPLPWVTVGAMIVIGSWILASVLFYVYIADIASYDSVFGDLAVMIVALAYLYLSTTAFLFGVQLDAIIRVQATGACDGDPGDDCDEEAVDDRDQDAADADQDATDADQDAADVDQDAADVDQDVTDADQDSRSSKATSSTKQ